MLEGRKSDIQAAPPAPICAAILAAGVFASAGPANAVVYCKTAGVPHGCVAARPVVAHPVVVVPVRRGPVVYCRRVRYPKGCIVR